MRKTVAVILLNWNTPKHTASCVSSLMKFCNESLFDIIVADNGSTDGSLAILKEQFSDLIYIDNKENLGFAEGNNRALKCSIANGYTYSLVMNTDTLVDEDVVTALVNHLDNNKQAAAVQPAIYWMHNRTAIWNGKGKFNRVLGKTISDTTLPNQDALKSYTTAEWLTGCCMLIRNSALTVSGLFNERFFLYFEDVDLSFRLRLAGFQLHYLPSVRMYHEAGVSASVEKKEGTLSPIIHYYVSRNHLWILRRYGSIFYLPVYVAYNGAYYLTLLIYFTIRGRFTKAKFLLKGIKDGLFTSKKVIWPLNN